MNNLLLDQPQQVSNNDDESRVAKYSGNQSSQNQQTPFGLQEKMIINNDERTDLSNEPSIQNQAQVNQPVAMNFQINPQLKKVVISKDQIKLHKPANNMDINVRADIHKISMKNQAKQNSTDNNVQILDRDVVPSVAQNGPKPMKIKMGQIMFTQSFIQ